MALTILRAVLICQLLAVLAESVFAGQFMAGEEGSLRFHEWTGFVALGLGVAQVVLAAVGMRSRVVSMWLLSGSVLVLLCEVAQIGSGFARALNVHIPLSVILFGVVAWQMVSIFAGRKGT